MKPLRKLSPLALAALLWAVPASSHACAVCYGAPIDSAMADGMNWAILTLGVFIASVLGTFLAFFIYIMRKSAALETAAQLNHPPNHSPGNFQAPAKV